MPDQSKPIVSLYQQFMAHDSHIGPRPEPETIQPNKLDAHYVGRVMDMLSDAAQMCVKGNHIDVQCYRDGIPNLARRIVHETFAEDISPNAIS